MDDPALLEAVLAHTDGISPATTSATSPVDRSPLQPRAPTGRAPTRIHTSPARPNRLGQLRHRQPAPPYDEPLGRTRWLERSITTQAGLTPTADPWRKDLTADQRRARQRLEQQGLLVEEPAGLMISAAVSYSLRLPIGLDGKSSVIHR